MVGRTGRDEGRRRRGEADSRNELRKDEKKERVSAGSSSLRYTEATSSQPCGLQNQSTDSNTIAAVRLAYQQLNALLPCFDGCRNTCLRSVPMHVALNN